jgi:glyceraldehyde-3-phosphate dehydrogenase/erythrose-4-phosphate dehydrogenase
MPKIYRHYRKERREYNIRGFGREGRRTQLRDYMRTNRLDIIGLQETIKQDFSTAELRSLEVGGIFAWNHLPAVGHSGGMLLGFRDESIGWGRGGWEPSLLAPLSCNTTLT